MAADLSLAQARRLALAAQGFARRRPAGRVDRRGLRRAMSNLQLLQLDSVQVVVRTQYLPLFSRLGPYRRALLDELAYQRGEWFETWAHEACLVPVGTEPLLRWLKQQAAAGQTWGRLVRLFEQEPGYVEQVYREVVERGPLAPSELSDPRAGRGQWWANRSLGAWAMDWLFRIGRLGVLRDNKFHKRYDLYERVIPEEIRAQRTPSPEEARRQLLLCSARALGVGTATDLADYFRLPVAQARGHLAELIDAGEFEQVTVESWRQPAYAIPGQRIPRRVEAAALLSPFDPIVWCRPRTERLFEFRYRIEIYVPEAKRQYGYYVLPFLLGDQLVARVDLKTDRARSRLVVRGAWCEPGSDPAVVAEALVAELAALAQLVEVERPAVETGAGGDLMSPLRKQLPRVAR